MTGPADHLERGTWNLICDRCGTKVKAVDTRRETTGLIMCGECFDAWDLLSHPQSHVRGVPDRQAVPFSRPEGADTFVSVLTWDDDEKAYV